MTTNTRAIAAERQHARIPTAYLIEFEGITDAELGSMSRDDKCPQEWRTFAAWELEYREASGFEIVYDPDVDGMRRRKV